MAFPVLSLFLQFVNMKNVETKSKKELVKDFIKKWIKYIVILLIVILMEYALIFVINHLLYEQPKETVKLINIEAFFIRLKYALNLEKSMFFYFMNMLPAMFFPAILIISIITLGLKKNSGKYMAQVITLIVITLLECMAFMFLFDSGQAGRTNWVFGTLWGILLMFLLLKFNSNQKIDKFVTGFIVVSFLFNAFMLLQNSAWHTATNVMDKNDGEAIKRIIDEYELETGIEVTKFAYMYDYEPSQYAPGIKKMGSLTERALSCTWSIKETINYYTQRNLKEVAFSYNIYFEKMKQKNFTSFSEEEIYIEGDTLYIIVY